MPLTYHVAQHSPETLSLLKQGWHKHMPFNPRNYRHTSDTRWTLSNTGLSNSPRGAFRSHVIFWFRENELRDGRFQCSGRLIWTAAAIQPHWPLLLEFTWGEKQVPVTEERGQSPPHLEMLLSLKACKAGLGVTTGCNALSAVEIKPANSRWWLHLQNFCNASSAAILCFHLCLPT